MILTFYFTFASLGPWLSRIMSLGIDWWTYQLEKLLLWMGFSVPLRSLVIDGICAGVGSVLSFIPVIGVLFLCLGILEESGYLHRLAYVMDKALGRFGIPGQAFVPLLMGFGCSVPAILAAGRIKNRREKFLTISLIPFMSCSAKLPIYSMMIPVFFHEREGIVTFSLYFMGIMLAIFLAIVYNKVIPKDVSSFKYEQLPPIKAPRCNTVIFYVWSNVKGFVKKAFTVIFAASIIIWFAQNFSVDLTWASSPDDSILASAGKLIAPIFMPLGFGDWHAAAALMAGLSAKEALVSTLAVLAGGTGSESLSALLGQTFTPLSAFSFLVFCLLYAPCIASLASVRRESGSIKHVLYMFIFQTTIAWLTAFIIFNIGKFFT